jgi:archaellum biogenesis ATPase FlaH
MSIEQIIFNNLVYNEPYARKVVPFIKDEYFSDYSHKILIGLIKSYIEEYNTFPNKESLAIDLSNKTDINQNAFDDCKNLISSLSVDQDHDLEWLENNTEKFCQDKAIYNSIMKSIEIIDDKTDNEKSSKGSIPQILSDALAVSFDTHIGHDFIEDAEERYDFYHKKEQKIPFDITLLNEVTKGGLPRKTLNIVMAGTGVGKSLFMCHAAAANLMAGSNVLYITLEMAEERISERIDANLLDEPLDSLKLLPKESYKKKVERLKAKTTGKLIVKEYPTACAGSANFRHLLNELKLKKKFKPDVIYIDYLNICMSSRIKNGSFVNSYTLIKSIAEELRGLAIEFNVPIVSATQTTRSGYSSSDVGLEDTSESFGLPATADFMFAIISTEELEGLGQIMVKQLKNRYADLGSNRRFVVGVDRAKMRLYDVENEAQDNIMNDSSKPVMDNTLFGTQENDRKVKFTKDKFEGFK